MEGKSSDLDFLMFWIVNWWSVDASLFARESFEDDALLLVSEEMLLLFVRGFSSADTRRVVCWLEAMFSANFRQCWGCI